MDLGRMAQSCEKYSFPLPQNAENTAYKLFGLPHEPNYCKINAESITTETFQILFVYFI